MNENLHQVEAANSLAALGNVTRLHLFRYLVQAGPDGAIIGTIQSHLDVPGSTLHHHIAKLVKVGLIEQEKKGREIICRANYDRMDNLLSFVTENCCRGIEELTEKKSA
ncbi:MAG: helix-turn-helix transcriptional regulator [Rhodospirillaceae bacterium]|jgi:ArsR family transcriptional regulator, arsenate/arsenite/antimonite-responsive transcriptional repressor|nr:helix-turn-helix transcriptional regulator [Rhodospirillaceae bacterium]MBT7953577.1 helix-turn-helix transcriptional regulator [Rhodospirillaceae bacterium]